MWFSKLEFRFELVMPSYQAPEVAAAWWEKMFGLRRAPVSDFLDEGDDANPAFVLVSGDDPNPSVYVYPRRAHDESNDPIPVIFTNDVKKAHTALTERGATPGPIQGEQPKFFELRDPEGNRIEISEEP